jgi:hypothetical protein
MGTLGPAVPVKLCSVREVSPVFHGLENGDSGCPEPELAEWEEAGELGGVDCVGEDALPCGVGEDALPCGLGDHRGDVDWDGMGDHGEVGEDGYGLGCSRGVVAMGGPNDVDMFPGIVETLFTGT